MTKTNLPVIMLRGIVLLPNNDIRLEFDSEISKNIIDIAELFHDSRVLIISNSNPLEETPSLKDLPKIGVIAKLSNKMELPNGFTRVIITGLKRANVHEYLNLNRSSEMLESIVLEDAEEVQDSVEEEALIKKLYREIENYVKMIPYVSNSIMPLISNVQDLGKMTDLIAPHLNINLDRLREYLNELDAEKRAEMILEDIYHEEEFFNIEREIDSKVKRSLDNSQKEYILREKIKYMKEELGDVSTKDSELEKLRSRMQDEKYPTNIKERLDEEIRRYEALPSMSPELNIERNYIDWLLDLPWQTYTVDEDNLKQVRKSLDSSHYGLEKVKERIIEYLAVKKLTNSLKSPIICFVGPPGTGKTSLAFSIAKALKRNFVKISVGGANDEAELIGHRKTYIGANPGRIIQSLKKAKSSNPVFLIDEIDKMTKSYKGDPASTLLEILDPEQNKFFSDNYIEEEYDLSNVMFIATANYLEDIPEALKDRLEIIELSGYTEYEKLDIAKRHLIPKICKEHGLLKNNITFKDEAILKIIRDYTKEAGVRELERQISTIVRKIVTTVVMTNKQVTKKEIGPSQIKQYLGKEKYHITSHQKYAKIGVVNGLAYTSYGGDTLSIEVNYYPGNGKLVLTGSLGDVMKESAQIALSYIKANHSQFKIDYRLLTENDLHIHVPEGAVPKDGPSAGITLTTALISALTNMRIPSDLAMTGEITLRGNILAIGGLKEKSVGASRNAIKRIIIPFDNKKDLTDIPKEIKEKIEYIPVKNYNDVFKYLKKISL